MNFAEFMRGGKPREQGYKQVWPPFEGGFLRHRRVQQVLDGDMNALMSAFGWTSTPQLMHWSAVQRGKTELSESDIDYLRFLLEQPERG